MTSFQKIEKIRIEQGLGINDFINSTGISKTSYYALKDGRTEKLTSKTINKIVDTYPQYTYEWLSGSNLTVLKSTNEINEVGSKITQLQTLEDIANFVIDHEKELQEVNSFKYWLKTRTLENREEELKSFINQALKNKR